MKYIKLWESAGEDELQVLKDLVSFGLISPKEYLIEFNKLFPQSDEVVRVDLSFDFDWGWGEQHTEEEARELLIHWFVSPAEDMLEGYVVLEDSVHIEAWEDEEVPEDEEDYDYYSKDGSQHWAVLTMICWKKDFIGPRLEAWADELTGRVFSKVDYYVDGAD